MGDVVKLFLVKLIGLLIASTGVATLVVIIVKIGRDAGLHIAQVGKNGPVPSFELFGLEARPETLDLRIVVTLATPAVRELGLGLAQQGLVGVGDVLPTLPGTTAVGVDNQAGGGPLGQHHPLQIAGNQNFTHIAPYLPTQHALGAHILKGAQVGPTGYDPGPVGQAAGTCYSPTPGSPGSAVAGRAADWGHSAVRGWNRSCAG